MYTFKKEERLCSKRLIEELFSSGSSFLLYPFKVNWKRSNLPATVPAQVIISVSKRKFKRAHDRNLLKRRIREAYRLHKNQDLYPGIAEIPLIFAISYIGKEIMEYKYIEKKLLGVFVRLIKECAEQHDTNHQ